MPSTSETAPSTSVIPSGKRLFTASFHLCDNPSIDLLSGEPGKKYYFRNRREDTIFVRMALADRSRGDYLIRFQVYLDFSHAIYEFFALRRRQWEAPGWYCEEDYIGPRARTFTIEKPQLVLNILTYMRDNSFFQPVVPEIIEKAITEITADIRSVKK